MMRLMAASHGPPGRWGRFPRSRRRRLPLLIVAGLLLAAVGGAHGAAAQGADGTPTPTNPIVRENALPGDRDWYVSQPAQSTATGIAPDEEDESGERPAAEVWVRAPLEGYADRTSVERGGTLGFYVSSTAPRFDLTVSRMGWYGGAGGRAVHRVAGLRGEVQPLPPPDPATGLVAAEWRLSYSLRIPEDWTSGVYIARLRAVGETIDEAQMYLLNNPG